jgi:hypothetical protein
LISTVLIMAMAWVPSDVGSYIASRTDIAHVADSRLQWATTPVTTDACSMDLACLDRLSAGGFASRTLADIDAYVNQGTEPTYFVLRLTILPGALGSLSGQQSVVVSLPPFNHKRAAFFAARTHLATLLNGERLVSSVDTRMLTSAEPLELHALLEVRPSDRPLAGLRNGEGVLVASRSEFEHYRDFLGAKNSSAAGAMGHLSKIVLALFCLMLFLIVDSSPESYGLALFMGYEAAAMGIGMGWLPSGFFGLEHASVVSNFCYQMGDILKLYFLFQMARVGGTSARWWLLLGTLVSLPYGFFMEYAGQHSITWVYKIPRTRDTIVGGLGSFVCLRALWSIRGQTLPWRKAALGIAAVAALFEVLNTYLAHSDWIRSFPTIQTLFTVSQLVCGFLFALSTFLNISTLENRVRSLTRAKARADEIERELEVGQIVQQAILKPPTLPSVVDLTCHHEAALYVSGDTYYAHWNDPDGVFTFLVNDVTGHGVQAALKASACNVLAKTIWENGAHGGRPGSGERLVEYDRVTGKLLVEMNAVSDFNSLVGAEFTPATGELVIYRSNFTFPILIEPVVPLVEEPVDVLGELWRPSVLVSRNREIHRCTIPRGSFVLFLSDGFMESSREAKQFTDYLRRELAKRDDKLTCDAITDVVLRFEGFKNRRVVDDRTLLAFQWRVPYVEAVKADRSAWVPVRRGIA